MTINSRNRPYLVTFAGMFLQLVLLFSMDYPIKDMHRINSFSDAFFKMFLFPYIPTFLFMIYMGYFHPKERNPRLLGQVFLIEAFICLFFLVYHLYVTPTVIIVLILTIIASTMNARLAFSGYKTKILNTLTRHHMFYILCIIPYIYYIHKFFIFLLSGELLSAFIFIISNFLITVSQIAIMRRAKFNKVSKNIELPKQKEQTGKKYSA